MKEKILTPLLTLACLLAVPATAQVNYAASGGSAYVVSSPNASGDIVIDSTYNGYPVTFIGRYAFADCTGLTSVTIPNSVITIEFLAFSGCTSLSNVTIGNSVVNIGDAAFAGCTSLTRFSVAASNPAYSSADGVLFNKARTSLLIVPAARGGSYVIPNSVTNIVIGAFDNCTSLTSVTIPSSVTSIAFNGCTSLTNLTVDPANPAYSSLDGVLFDKAQTTLITFPAARGGSYVIPNSVTSIGGEAFSYCTRLTSVTIGNSVTNIGFRAFVGCTSFTSVAIPNSVTSIGGWAFFYCTTLTSVTIGNSVTSIGIGAFENCTSLTSITIGNSVTGIGADAFAGCTRLTSVTIPNSVTRIGYSAFGGCTSLTNLTLQGNAPFLEEGWFPSVGPGARVYYYCGTTGWGPTYGGLPTVMLVVPRIGPGSAGVKPGGFGFTLTCLTNQTIVVEASTNLATWQPIWTNTLSGLSTNFVDPRWLNHPSRFYRARSN